MATKKRTDQLEKLLDWTRNGDRARLPQTTDLFNRKIGDHLYLRETEPRSWVLELFEDVDGKIHRQSTFLKHTTLVQLGLTILEAVDASEPGAG